MEDVLQLRRSTMGKMIKRSDYLICMKVSARVQNSIWTGAYNFQRSLNSQSVEGVWQKRRIQALSVTVG